MPPNAAAAIVMVATVRDEMPAARDRTIFETGHPAWGTGSRSRREVVSGAAVVGRGNGPGNASAPMTPAPRSLPRSGTQPADRSAPWSNASFIPAAAPPTSAAAAAARSPSFAAGGTTRSATTPPTLPSRRGLAIRGCRLPPPCCRTSSASLMPPSTTCCARR